MPSTSALGSGAGVGAKKKTKSSIDWEEFQQKILSLACEEEDEVDVTLSAMGKKIKRVFNDIERDEVLDELHDVISRHVRRVRAKYAAPSASLGAPPMPQHDQQMQGQGQGQASSSDVYNAPPLPTMQRISYDANNSSYYNF